MEELSEFNRQLDVSRQGVLLVGTEDTISDAQHLDTLLLVWLNAEVYDPYRCIQELGEYTAQCSDDSAESTNDKWIAVVDQQDKLLEQAREDLGIID